MDKREYMKQLAYRLRKLPKEDYERAMEYFCEYFEDAGVANEQIAIRDLGSPEDAANQIIQDIAYEALEYPKQEKIERKKLSVIWITILAVFASPIALPLAFGILMLIIGILFAALVVVLSVAFSAAVTVGVSVFGVIGGIILSFQAPANGIATLGLSLCSLGIGMLITLWAIRLTRAFRNWIPKLLRKFLKKKGDSINDKN